MQRVALLMCLTTWLTGCASVDNLMLKDNLYLTNIFVRSDGSVVVDVNLPENNFGYLFLDNSDVALNTTIVQSGSVELGILRPGTHTVCLKLFIAFSSELAVVTECLDFVCHNRKPSIVQN